MDTKHRRHIAPIRKADTDLMIVYAEVYAPDFPDSQKEYMSAEEIRKMAHLWMKEGNVFSVDTNHDGALNGSYVVESFIARPGDPDFIEGAWVVGIQVTDPDLWQAILDGEINGLSMEALVCKVTELVEIDIPEYVDGGTDVAQGHSHTFRVYFSPEGEFLGGKTGETDGHYHDIRKGTATEETEDHSHRFSFVELVS